MNALDRGEHGRAAWRLGCDCSTCHGAMRRYAVVDHAARQLRRGREPATRVPVGRVRRRLGELEAAGWNRRAIARAAGVAPATLTRIAKPATKRISRIVAAAVLGVPVP